MRRRLAVLSIVVGASVLAVIALIGYLTFIRAPIGAPSELCGEPPETTGTPRIVAAGASIVRGRLGSDWVDILRHRHPDHEFVNAGINGDTSRGVLERLDRDVLACDPDAVLLLVGTNDVRDDVPLDKFASKLDAIVDRIKSQGDARIALISLPPLGEVLTESINHTLTGYNSAIRDVAAHNGIGYLPFFEEIEARLLQDRSGRPEYAFSFPRAFTAAARHHLLRQSWDEISQSAGLEFLVDHIHLSDRGGAVLVELASDWISDT